MDEVVVLSALQNEQSMKNTLEIALDSIGRGKDFQKPKAHQFLTLILNQIQKQNSPQSKFYSILMLKQATEKGETKLLSVLSSHNLLKFMSHIAKDTDPNKPINDKGKSLFPDKKMGNQYIRLILQCMRVWGQKYKNNKNDQPTKFRKFYNQLVETKVVMPSDLKFFNPSFIGGSSRQSDKKVSENYVSPGGRTSIQQPSKGLASGSSHDKDFKYSLDKINTLIEILNTEEEYQQYIHNYHNLFTKELKKYQSIINELISTGDEKGTESALQLTGFYQAEKEAYQQYVTDKNDYYSYVMKIQMEAQKVGAGNVGSPMRKVNSNAQSKREDNHQEISTRKVGKNNFQSTNQTENKQLVSQLMNRLNQNSKAPKPGFKSIRQSLSKDKSLGKTKRSASRLKKSSVSKFGHSRSKSRIADIFSTPPNPYPKDKRYEGQAVEKHYELSNVTRGLSKHQGIRRFITCNFKSKSPLYENTHLQIGLKSEPIYQEVSEFKTMINIELYIGNKTEDMLKNVSIQYKGNQDVLLYGNPRTVDTILEGGYQSKHQLLVVPINYQFPLIKMIIKYSVNGDTINETITLPNSILKLASYRTLSKKEFVQHWNNSDIFKTKQFKLTRYIAPDSLAKYIVSLDELSSYQQFISKGSEADFQLGCLIVLKQQFEGVLKISVRPNLNAVIQVGVLDNSEESHESFIFYIQSLQMLLTHAEHQL